MEQVMKKPWGKEEFIISIKKGMTDPIWPQKEGWKKYGQRINEIEIHYLRNSYSGAVDDFKFKN
jgi:hypothetical protein